MAAGERVFRDPIYGYISVEEPLIGIVDHWMFQRLRRISQTSLTSYVYPSATGSRFEHALGSMHLARRAWTAIWGRGDEPAKEVRDLFKQEVRADHEAMPDDDARFGERIGLALRAAALLHDVGHTPFSHALEEVYRRQVWRVGPDSLDAEKLKVRENLLRFHEYCGRLIAEQICADVFSDGDKELARQELPALIRAIINDGPAPWARTLHRLISGQIDVDRIDYLIRDSYKAAGSEFGSIDYARLLDAMEMHDSKKRVGGRRAFEVLPGVRARSAVETLLIQRLQAYEYIHFHPRVVGYNLALERAMTLFLRLSETEGVDPLTGPIRHILGEMRPNLVYWRADAVDVSGALGIRASPAGTRGAGQASLEGFDDAEELIIGLGRDEAERMITAAGVDDGTVVETLKRAYLIAAGASDRQKPVSGPPSGDSTRTDLEHFEIYARAALFRRKNFVPAWKNAEEYMDAASEMRSTLLERVPELLRARAAAGQRPEAETLEALAIQIEGALEVAGAAGLGANPRVGPAIALNRLVELLLFREEVREVIRAGLNDNPVVDRKRGVWDLKCVGDAPSLDVYLRSEGRNVPIVDSSPLAEAVSLAEQQRVKLAVFFFAERVDYSDPNNKPAGSMRTPVRRAAVERLPDLILNAIKTHV